MTKSNERRKRKRRRVESLKRDNYSLDSDPLHTSDVDPSIFDFYFEKQDKRKQLCWMTSLNNLFGFKMFLAEDFHGQATKMDDTSWKKWREQMISQFKVTKSKVSQKKKKEYASSLLLSRHGLSGGWTTNVISDFIEAHTPFQLRRFAKSAKYPINRDIIETAVDTHGAIIVCLEWQQHKLHQSHAIAIKKTADYAVVFDGLEPYPCNISVYPLIHACAIYYIIRKVM